MITTKDFKSTASKGIGSSSTKRIKSFFVTKGYNVCTVKPIDYSNNWMAVLIKNSEFVIATVFTNGNKIERYEASVMQ